MTPYPGKNTLVSETLDDLTVSLLSIALREDIGDEDITTKSIVPADSKFKGKIIAKENGIIAGLRVIDMLYTNFFAAVKLVFFSSDGESVTKGKVIAEVLGPGHVLLSTERLMLNILQRMSGIATQTALYVEQVKGTEAIILDTRKTAPGLRSLDKMSVRIGGGTNHRQGLFDSYLIKENHIAAAGGLTEAVKRVQKTNARRRMVEVEVRSHGELLEALGLAVDRILLDNMSVDDMKLAVKTVGGKIPLEASGNITLQNVREVAETGVDFISVGSLTHSVRALDLSFLLEEST